MESAPKASFVDVDQFSSHYQRNNKRGSVKNLRCFPSCSALHKQRGFCGRSVVMKVSGASDNLECFCEFVKQDEPRQWDIGHTITVEECEALTRTKQEPLRPWVRGALTSNVHGEALVEFNQEKRGWHYGWASNKHTCNSKHVLVAYLLRPTPFDNQTLRIVGVAESPPFMLFCRRRRRFTIIPNAPISVPKSSKQGSAAAAAAAAAAANGENGEDDFDEDDFDDEDDGEDDAAPPPPPPPPPPSAKPKKTLAKASTSANKRTKVLHAGAAAASAMAKTATPVAMLDKNRVDALLTLLHMAWRKMKEVPPQSQQPQVEQQQQEQLPAHHEFPTSPEMHAEAFMETDFFAMLDFFGGAGGMASTTTLMTEPDFSLTAHDVSTAAAASDLDPILPHVQHEADSFDDMQLPPSSSPSSPLPPPPLPPPPPPPPQQQQADAQSEAEEWSNPDVEDLARYLLDSADFRQGVAWLRPGQGAASPDFSAFLGVLRDHIQIYMRLREWTLVDLDRIIYADQHHVKVEDEIAASSSSHAASSSNSPSPQLHSAYAGATGSSSPRHFYISSTGSSAAMTEQPADALLLDEESAVRIPNITGNWSQTSESKAQMERVRERTGSSWVMSKLFEFMESKFTVQQSGNELSCRLWPMPALKFILDGEERPWGIRLPLFQPNWTYRAWTDGDVIHLQHQIENRRLTRRYWCDEDRKKLYSEATLEIYDMNQRKFQEESRVVQVAERV